MAGAAEFLRERCVCEQDGTVVRYGYDRNRVLRKHPTSRYFTRFGD